MSDAPASPLDAAVRAVAARRPDAVALVRPDGASWTYGRLVEEVDARASLVGPGAPGPGRTVVGLALRDPFAFVATYLAVARAGGVAVLLDAHAPDAAVAQGVRQLDVARLVRDDGAVDVPAHRPAQYEDDDFVVHRTSGSTGEAKGIVMSQRAIDARVRLWGGHLGLGPDDVVLCPLPLDHCHGIDVLTMPTLAAGGTVVLAHGPHLTARGVVRTVAQHGVTVVSALPLLYDMLVRVTRPDPAALASLRLAISGSAPLPVETQDRFADLWHRPLRQVYGLSEIGVITFDAAHRAGGTIGVPVPGVRWRAEPVDDAADALLELYVQGPALARGYYRDEAATAQMFVDGWLRTHDLVETRPDGWFVRGRRSGFVNVAGSKVGPLEVEQALRGCAGVVDAAVVALPDPVTTQCVGALLVVDGPFDRAALDRELAGRLAAHQRPRRYAVTTALPRTPLGKTDYAAALRYLEDAA